jgi:hypothetical protein
VLQPGSTGITPMGASMRSAVLVYQAGCHGHTEPAAFDASDDAVAHILARHASIAVAHARKEASLMQAVDARKLIGQAQGILMERFRVDAEGAFAILRRYSQDNNRKLRDVAVELIHTRKLPN